jgi:SAM-dependent methyltransferase
MLPASGDAGAMSIFRIDWEATRGKGKFVRHLARHGRVLDVGCGNNSPVWFKSIRSDLHYVGVDVGDYCQSADPRGVADEYIICSPDEFAHTLERFSGQMHGVVSCHNLEHCNEPERVLAAMVGALRPGGFLYLSFPCEESTRFPKRAGCLNFFDDSTHRSPPSWSNTIDTLKKTGCEIVFQARRYRPFPLLLRGLVLEPWSAYRRRVATGGATWALYGFESVIWCKKQDGAVELRDWGPRSTQVGAGVNLQPNGNSAVWIEVSNINGYGEVYVEFGRTRMLACVQEGLVTSIIPNEILSTPGRHNIHVVEACGRRSAVGEFVVQPL